jgi:predicted ATPase/DNA-binding CsgD family transcriptional regulator/DNA-binding SARP family transcriptional activator
MATIHIQLLGDFQLTIGSAPIEAISQPSQQALLAYLVLHRHTPVTRRELARQVLPHTSITEPLPPLDSLLEHLIQMIPDGSHFFTLTSDTVQWRPDAPYTLDVADFEAALARAQVAAQASNQDAVEQHLAAAAKCYGGDLLPGCDEDWVNAERRRLHTLYVDALARLAPMLEQRGAYAEAVAYARVLRQHSLQYEPLYRRLTHLHVLSGGRAGLLQVLEQRLAALVRGQGALVLIQGVAGIGKTSLALVCEEQAHRLSARFVSGHCYERGVTSPFNPWQEVLATLATSGIDLSALPEPFGQGPPAQSAHQLIQAITARLHAAAVEQPLALLLDDLHWADQDSLDLLDFATRHLTDIPLLILVTYRSEEVHRNRPLFSFLPTLQRNRPIETIHLGALSPEDTMRLVEAYHGPCSPQLARYLYERAEGHPLFLVQLLNDLVERNLMAQDALGRWLPPAQTIPVPTLLQQVIGERVARLGPQAEQLLEVAAVVGETWELGVTEAVLNWPEEQLLTVLEQALASDVIVATDAQTEHYRFGHGLIREVLYNRQLARRRKQLHGRIATLLETRRPVGVAALAHHDYEAGRWEPAYQYSLAAGDAARRRYAMHSAVQFYRQALDAAQKMVNGRPVDTLWQLHERLGETYAALNHKEEAVAAFTRMVETTRTAGNLLAEGRALSELAKAQTRLHHWDEAQQTSNAALHVAQQLGDLRLLALNHLQAVHLSITMSEVAQAAQQIAQAEHFVRTINEPALLCEVLRYQSYLAMWSGPYAGAERLALEALGLARDVQDAISLAALPFVLGFVQIELGRYEQAWRSLQDGLAYAGQVSEQHRYFAKVANMIGYLHQTVGDFATASQWNLRALDAVRDVSPDYTEEAACYALLDLASCHLQLGRLAAASAYVQEFEAVQLKANYVRFRFMNRYQLLQAELALAQGEFARVFVHTQAAAALAQEKNVPKNLLKSLLYEGQALLGLGRQQEAANRLQQAVKRADQIEHAALRWQSRLRLAQAYASLARPNTDLYDQGLAIVEGLAVNLQDERLRSCFLASPLVVELKANAQSALLPQQPQASTPLQEAKQSYGGLTRREREVAALIAQGKSNRAIADTLVLGERTVEGHVSNILGKLGFTSRAQIAAWVVEKGL